MHGEYKSREMQIKCIAFFVFFFKLFIVSMNNVLEFICCFFLSLKKEKAKIVQLNFKKKKIALNKDVQNSKNFIAFLKDEKLVQFSSLKHAKT